VGIFGMGFRLAGIAGIVLIGFQGSLTPFIYANHTKSEMPQQLAKLFRIFVACALLFFVSVTLFSHEIFELFTVPSYYNASTLLVYLVPAIFLSNMYIFAPGASIAKKTQIILCVNLAGAILNILINILFIPHFGIEGASVAKLISCGCVFLGYMINSQKLYYVPHAWWGMIRTTIIISLLAYVFQSISNPFLINFSIKLIVIFVSAALILHAGLVKLSELKQLQQLLAAKFFYNKNKSISL
jgi:O-antigen/teichoic acid export membrane protein